MGYSSYYKKINLSQRLAILINYSLFVQSLVVQARSSSRDCYFHACFIISSSVIEKDRFYMKKAQIFNKNKHGNSTFVGFLFESNEL